MAVERNVVDDDVHEVGLHIVGGPDEHQTDELDEAALDGVVQEINRISRRKRLEAALEIGEMLIARCFGGEPDRIHAQGRHPHSFRALAAREDLEVSYSFLWYCVAVTEQHRALPPEVANALSFAHHKALLTEKDVVAKRALAIDAAAGRLTVDALRAALSEHLAATQTSRAGRPALPGFVKVTKLARQATAFVPQGESAHAEIRRGHFCESAAYVRAGLEDLRRLVAWFEELDAFVNIDVEEP